MTSVICWSLVSPNQPWPPLAWAKAAGANVSRAPTHTVSAIMRRARRMARSVPLLSGDGDAVAAPPPPPPRRSAPGCSRRCGRRSPGGRWAPRTPSRRRRWASSRCLAGETIWSRPVSTIAAGGRVSEASQGRESKRPSSRPASATSRASWRMSSDSHHAVRSLSRILALRKAGPVEPAGREAQQHADRRPSISRACGVSGSWKCWQVPLSTSPLDTSRWSRAMSWAIAPPIE